MFDSKSRYYSQEVVTLTVTNSEGETVEIRYAKRRFIPSTNGTTLVEYSVIEGDRPDNIAARYLGDPQQFWRICDSNYVLQPDELTDTIGNVIKVTMPQL